MTRLAETTSPVVGLARSAVLVVPVGATEQHGPHLPLGTDTLVAEALARDLPGCVVAPSVAYGSSGEHAGFPGTLSIGREATELLLVELGRSATETFGRVLLLSAHGGNTVPVRRATATLVAEGRDVRAWSPRWGGDAHAGRTETSLLLALHEDLVGPERPVGATEELAALLPALQDGGLAAVTSSGVLGDASGASAAEGVALLAAARADLLALLAGW